MADVGRQRRFLTSQTNARADWVSKPEVAQPTERRTCAVPDPTYVTEYSPEICDYFLEEEWNLYRERAYMERQSEVTDRMRKILVDWLIDVVSEFNNHPETFYLAVDIIDRFLYQREIPRTKLQLVGITAVLIAAKHEEIWPPTVNDCVVVTANTYTSREVIEMEREIAVCLRFKFTVPTTYPLASHFLDAAKCTPQARDAVFLFLESAAHCYAMLTYMPSRIAAAATVLGRLFVVFNNSPHRADDSFTMSLSAFWGVDLMKVSNGISVEELTPVVTQLLPFTQRLCSSSSKLQAVRRKYLSQKYHSVASLEFPSVGIIS